MTAPRNLWASRRTVHGNPLLAFEAAGVADGADRGRGAATSLRASSRRLKAEPRGQRASMRPVGHSGFGARAARQLHAGPRSGAGAILRPGNRRPSGERVNTYRAAASYMRGRASCWLSTSRSRPVRGISVALTRAPAAPAGRTSTRSRRRPCSAVPLDGAPPSLPDAVKARLRAPVAEP